MKLEMLHEFVTVAKYQSFSRAAKELYLSQSGLSAHIGSTEKDLGFDLFDRTNNRVVLTPAGSIFLEYAQKILETYQEALDKSKAIAQDRPPIKISSVSSGSKYYWPLLQAEGPPFVFIDIDLSTSLLDAIEKNIVDVGISADHSIVPSIAERAKSRNIVYSRIGEEKCGICMMKTHPLATKKALSKRDLHEQTAIINSGAHFDDWKQTVQKILGDDVCLRFRLNTIESLSNLAIIDLCDSLYVCGYDSVKEYFCHRDDIVIFDKIDDQELYFPTALVYQEDNPNEQVSEFVKSFLCALEKH